MIRHWFIALLGFVVFLTAGCSISSSPVVNQPQAVIGTSPANSSQGTQTVIPLIDLQQMIASHPENVGAILEHYRAPVNPTPWIRALPLPGQANRYALPDGETFVGKSDGVDSGDDVINNDDMRQGLSYTQPLCSNPSQWSGMIPPTCDTGKSAGPFRRPVSPPNYSLGLSYVNLPATMPGMSGSPSSDTGFLYIEPWPGPNTSNSEVGLQYSVAHNWYTVYIRTIGHYYISPNGHFDANQTVVFEGRESQTPAYECKQVPCFGGEVVSQNPNCKATGNDCYDANAFSNSSLYELMLYLRAYD